MKIHHLLSDIDKTRKDFIKFYFKNFFSHFIFIIINIKFLIINFTILSKLNKNGFVVLNDYVSSEECKKCELQLKYILQNNENFIHFSDDLRMFGVDKLLELAKLFSEDTNLLKFSTYVNHENSYFAFNLGGWLKYGNEGSSGGGWHRDAFFSQFKTMIYLTEVDENNGPLEIIPGSHKLNSVLSSIKKTKFRYQQHRYTNIEIEKLQVDLNIRKKTITGKPGTLIIFNSSVIHRGKPIDTGERLSLTSYYFPQSRPLSSLYDQFKPLVTNDLISKIKKNF